MKRVTIVALLVSSFLTACSGLRITSYENPKSNTAPYKLNTGKPLWINNENIQISITKHYYDFHKENAKIIPGDLVSAKNHVNEIVSPFRDSLPAKLSEQLITNGIMTGEDNVIEITPIFANYECAAPEKGKPCQGGLIREFKLSIHLKDKATGKLLFSTRTESFITKTKPENYNAIISDHASSIIKALISQNWLCSPEQKRFNQCVQNKQ